MADVRSMLRNERAARRITHPQAQYTSSGALVCKACHVQLKSDAIWQSHISSPQHINALKSLASGLMGQNSNKGTKRKADEDDLDEESARKRTKPTNSEIPIEATLKVSDQPGPLQQDAHATAQTEKPNIDEDEWAAFEREVANESPPEAPTREQVIAGATISAAPVTAAELAARARDEQSEQAKEQRQAEIEDEKEDAQRRLEEEFDEMEDLEARVKRLKDQREALRRKTVSQGSNASTAPNIPQAKSVDTDEEEEEEEEDDDDSEDDDWDNWGAI